MEKIVLKVSGMTCSACQVGLEKKLLKKDGIYKAEVNLIMNNANIEYDQHILGMKDIEDTIKEAGYKSLGIDNYKDIKNKDNKTIFLLAVMSIIIVYVSMAEMIMLPVIPFFNRMMNPINYSVSLFLLTLPVLFIGRNLIISGTLNLINKSPNMDTLVTIGVVSAFLYSTFGTIMITYGNNSYVQSLYYESAVVVIFFIKLGKYIENNNKNKTKDAIRKLMELTPNEATIIKDGEEISVHVSDVKVGDIVLVKPGGKIAFDGVVVKGISSVNESFITGESIPINKCINDSVIAGSINYDGYLQYKALKIGKDTTISQIVKLVIESAGTKAPISRLADKVSGYFVPFIIIIALSSLIFWMLAGETVAFSLNIFISLLVIACPCALGLATPLAIMISTGSLANKAILVKNSAALENAHKIKTVVFDKTGTLTTGNLGISKIYNFSELSEHKLMEIIGGVENKSEHPIARAITNWCNKKNIMMVDIFEFKSIPGYGITAKYQNTNIIIGNKTFMEDNNIDISVAKSDFENLVLDGCSILYTVFNNRLVSLIGLKDEVKSSSKKTVSKLIKKGIKVVMLTGDNEQTARKIADKIGIKNVISNVLPHNKREVICTLKKDGLVMMVGDGINDSPSLVTADIGVAIGSGTDIAIDSADVILIGEDLNKINDFIYVSKRTIINIKQNLFWAFFYNIAMIPIAMGFLNQFNIILNPMIAGFAMTVSSITVVLNALRLKKIRLL